MSLHTRDTDTLSPAQYVGAYIATLAYYLVMWAVAAVIVVGIVGMTVGMTFQSAQIIIIGLTIALFAWHTNAPAQQD